MDLAEFFQQHVELPPGFEWMTGEFLPMCKALPGSYHTALHLWLLGPEDQKRRPTACICFYFNFSKDAPWSNPRGQYMSRIEEAVLGIQAMLGDSPSLDNPHIHYQWISLT